MGGAHARERLGRRKGAGVCAQVVVETMNGLEERTGDAKGDVRMFRHGAQPYRSFLPGWWGRKEIGWAGHHKDFESWPLSWSTQLGREGGRWEKRVAGLSLWGLGL